ncbi:MAG: hypothetical protein M0P29_14220, partial [Sphaerochaetaceae bacterium]|nr:hypothetical protein [Sphaerochaetaceae bacterium]
VEFAGTLAVGGPLLIAISATINAVRNLSSVVMAAFVLPGAPWIAAAASVAGLIKVLKDFDKVQKEITGRAPAEVLDRSKYMQRAGEIFAERYGKYPITVEEYKELDKIIDELIAKERKTEVEVEVIPKITTPQEEYAMPQFGEPIDLSALLGTEEERKKLADEATKAERERVRQIGITTAAEIERIENVKQMQLEAQEAAAEGVRRFWRDVNWEYNQGLIDAQSYFDMLSGELERVTQGSEEWKRTFQEIQRVALDIVNTNIDALTEQLRAGKITTEEFNAYVAELKERFQDLPLVVNRLDDALKNTKRTTEDLTLQTQLWARDLSKGLADAIVYGRSLSDVLNNILKQLASSMLQKLIFGWLPFEKGGVVSKGKLQPFASGGIVASPTIFPMANGAGLMGEAGPEAIMPLKRTSSGDLGVKAEGGGDHISVTMNINAVDAKSFVDLINSNRTVIESIVVNNFTRNGRIRRVIQEAV